MMGKFINMLNSKYGRLTVVSRAPNQETRAAWHCICDCGNKIVVDGKKLRSGHTSSCGCYRKEVTAMQGKVNTKHGQSRTKGYQRFHSRLREIAEIRQRPKWADMQKIREIYVNRRMVFMLTTLFLCVAKPFLDFMLKPIFNTYQPLKT